MTKNEVRIIGGKWKGRKLRFPDRPGLRPSLGRARETTFNWLVGSIDGAACLDLFAGSGSLGFEAESRGAASVVLVERDRRTAAALKSSATVLGAHGRVIVSDAQKYLRSAATPFDLIFMDPPFAQPELAASAIRSVLDRALLAPDGAIYVELPRRWALPAELHEELIWRKSAIAGEARFGLLAGPC